MSSRTPTRWLAPIALLVALAAVGYVVRDFTSSASDEEPAATTTTTERQTESGGSDEESDTETTAGGDGETTTSTTPRGGRTVRVGEGDTLGSIAEENDLSVEEIVELNPDLDPNSLNVGDRVKLAP